MTQERVEVLAGELPVAEAQGGYQQSRVHAFCPMQATKIQLTVLKVRDPRCRARVCEVWI